MEQQQQVIEMANKQYTFVEIQNTLAQEWGAHSIKPRTIYKYIALAKCGVLEAVDGRGGDRRSDEVLDQRILETLDEYPFASSRMIAFMLNIFQSRAINGLYSLGYVFKYTKWHPHELTSSQKFKRLKGARDLRDLLYDKQKNDWTGLVK